MLLSLLINISEIQLTSLKYTKDSYKTILRSSSIIGGASVVNIVLSIARMKVAAVFLGPAGVGLIGLFSNLVDMGTSIASMGINRAGVRQIADSTGTGDLQTIATARRALFWATLALALLGAAVFWLLRGFLSVKVLHDPNLSGDVGWLALAVGLSVASGSQGALLTGLRRIGDLSRVSVLSALFSSVLGIAAILFWEQEGLVVYMLAGPLASFFFGHWYVSKIKLTAVAKVTYSEIAYQWHTLVKLGFAFMLAALVSIFGLLIIRSIIQNQLGLQELGYFQAAWAISVTYIGFVLGAMSTDYYPRLTAAMRDHVEVNRMVNEQTEIAFLLAGPILLAMMALAPWVIQLLYSREFMPATDVLHWQILGDVLKLASWPLGFVILAAGDGKIYMFSESMSMGTFVLLTWLMIPWLGLEASGLACLGMYVVSLPLVYWLAKRRTGFYWESIVIKQIILMFVAASVIMVLARYSQNAAAGFGLLLSAAFGLYGFSRLAHKTELKGGIGKMAMLVQKQMKRIGVWHE